MTDPDADAMEIGRLLTELLRVGHVERGVGAAQMRADAGEPPAARDGSATTTSSASGPGSAHLIRAAIHIHDAGPQTIGGLAQGLGISQGWASRVVDALEQAGYVVRQRDVDDRRVVRVHLTPMAVERVERAHHWRGGAVEAALGGMGPQERAAVRLFLRRFLEASRAPDG